MADPSAAMSPMLAARIIVQGMSEGWFTGVKMSDCATYRDMRKVVNGMDKADLIAGHAAKFETALLEAERQAPRPDVEPVEAMPEAGSQPGLIAAVVTILAALAAYLGFGK